MTGCPLHPGGGFGCRNCDTRYRAQSDARRKADEAASLRNDLLLEVARILSEQQVTTDQFHRLSDLIKKAEAL